MLAWVNAAIQRTGAYFLSWGDPTDKTTEIRLIAFGSYVFIGLAMIWLEFRGTGHINNQALITLGGVCGIGTLSMRGGQ